MPRIAPIPWEKLTDEARARIEAGMATGMYSMTLPLQIVAHSPNALQGMDESYKAIYGRAAIGPRILELMRLRSAQLGSCAPCSLSRKDESITEEDVACLVDPSRAGANERERLAIRLVDLMATDHHAIDSAFFRQLAEEFSREEIVELAWYAGQVVGGHRFMHVLDVLGDDEPVIRPEGAMTSGIGSDHE
jgi:alkylhydroperoxidase family enzyme